MLHTRAYLDRCHELLRLGHAFVPRSGLRIGRGFADVGYEEYSLLSESTMISLSTGKTGSLEESFAQHYFPIYSVDELTAVLYERGVDVETIRYVDQRVWDLSVLVSGQHKHYSARDLEEVFLTALIDCLKATQDVSPKK